MGGGGEYSVFMKHGTIGVPIDRYVIVLQENVQFIFNDEFLFFKNTNPLRLGSRAAQRKALFETEYQTSHGRG